MLRRLLTAFLLATLALAACGGSDDAASPTTEPRAEEVTSTTEAPPPAPDQPGPYPVGRRTEQVTDPARDGRALTVEVWYPAAAAAEPTPYDLVPGVSFPSDLSRLDAEPSSEGPFPLVVFSHGSGGLRQQSASIVETIASHGFVVVAPDHAGNTAVDSLLGTVTSVDETSRNRVLDTVFLIDEVEAGRLASGLTSTEDLAVMGHSFGGFTALAVAGGYDGIPADPRVDAIVPMAPASGRLADESLAAIDVPMLIMTGSDDETTPVDDQSTRPLELAGGPATLVEIEGGSHEVVTNICDIAEAVETAEAELPTGALEAVRELAGSTCEPDAPISVQKAFDIVEHHAVAFLRQHLAGDDRYADVAAMDGATVRSP